MIEQPGLEYAYARALAALSGHPSEAVWQRLEATHELAASLEAARACPFLAACTAGLSAADGIHAIESRLRARLRERIEVVGSWLPPEWRAASQWAQALVHLPVFFYLYHGGPPLAWMREDPVLAPHLDADAASRQAAIAGGTLAPLAAHWNSGPALWRAWLAEWQRRWPHRASTDPLRALVRLAEEHLAAFPAIEPRSTWAERAVLRARLKALLRRAVLHPAAVFAYLAIAALDAERLRAVLVLRALFGPAAEIAH
jgi:hypothetical protein